ncbi:MAG: hypothetical protein MZW92_75945 [Comamonadaceae bacterium]|nr:hypothetical protein [Comamonadaceae bacterium]
MIAAAVAGQVALRPTLESEPPQITFAPDVDALGLAPLEIQVVDKGAGLKAVTATLSQGGTEHKLAAEQFDRPVGERRPRWPCRRSPA